MTNVQKVKAAMLRLTKSRCLPVQMDVMGSGYRLMSANGGRDISPRLKPKEMVLWLEAFETGLDEAQRK